MLMSVIRMRLASRLCKKFIFGESMQITGASLIAGEWKIAEQASVFYGFSPRLNQDLETSIYEVSPAMLDQAVKQAADAFKVYRQTPYEARALFLNTIADEIEALGSLLIETTYEETNLPMARLEGERGRTINQLRSFASALHRSEHSIANFGCIDSADPDRSPLPKPSTSLEYLPLGVVAVFGASNFPYAFSTLGGDTAAALAAGCPVVMKSHTAHPATSELMTRAMCNAIVKCDMPPGVFSMVQAKSHAISHQLVAHSEIKAVGFTGSFAVADKLIETIGKRREPIPFYGELGSINPQFVLSNKMLQSGEQLATQLCQALLMGNGQFCTSPGLWLLPAGSDAFLEQAVKDISNCDSDTLLSPNILSSFTRSVEQLKAISSVSLLAKGKLSESHHANAHLFITDLNSLFETPMLLEEVFGPMALIAIYDNVNQLEQLVDSLGGQLTATIYGTEADMKNTVALHEALQYKVGRIIENQVPTGVEVCPSMNHGGPYPSSTDVRTTSVGLNAMLRFLRPICRQRLN